MFDILQDFRWYTCTRMAEWLQHCCCNRKSCFKSQRYFYRGRGIFIVAGSGIPVLSAPESNRGKHFAWPQCWPHSLLVYDVVLKWSALTDIKGLTQIRMPPHRLNVYFFIQSKIYLMSRFSMNMLDQFEDLELSECPKRVNSRPCIEFDVIWPRLTLRIDQSQRALGILSRFPLQQGYF